MTATTLKSVPFVPADHETDDVRGSRLSGRDAHLLRNLDNAARLLLDVSATLTAGMADRRTPEFFRSILGRHVGNALYAALPITAARERFDCDWQRPKIEAKPPARLGRKEVEAALKAVERADALVSVSLDYLADRDAWRARRDGKTAKWQGQTSYAELAKATDHISFLLRALREATRVSFF